MMTDHVPAFKQLFKLTKPKNILEFGLGKSTRFLSKNCEAITSIELATNSRHKKWFRKVKDYKLPNWQGYLFETGDNYTPEMENYIKEKLKIHYDLIFVDPGVHCRADIVNLCFDKTPIIVAHDTGAEAYGWYRLEEPDDYVKISHEMGSGTTFWLRDKGLARKLKKNLEWKKF